MSDKTNHDLAEEYELKIRLLGRRGFKLEYLSNDGVMLVDVKDKEDSGRLVIPSFITSIGRSALLGCRYTDIYIDNKKSIDVKYLCGMLKSRELKVSFRHSELITDMRYMFSDCMDLIELDLSSVKTDNVKYMDGMFNGCKSLNVLDLSRFNTISVKKMAGLFDGCRNLRLIDISGFNTIRVVDMSNMFNGCESLVDIDVSKFNTSNVVDMSNMFNGCKSLNKLDLSNFNLDNIEYISDIVNGCKSLKLVVMKDNTRCINILVNELYPYVKGNGLKVKLV